MATIASDLLVQMNAVPNQDPIPVIVRQKRDALSAQAALPSAATVAQTFSLFPGAALKMTAAEIETVSQRDDIDMIWPDLPVQAWLDVSVPKISVPRVWEAGPKGAAIRVAIIDTGIDETHPDFLGRIRAMKSFIDDTPKDENGHGSHVASIVAGDGLKSNGKYVGVAPEAILYIAKVLDADGNGSMSGVMAGIEWAALDQQVQIINLSLGGGGSCDGTDALSTLCDEAIEQTGVIICVAAGNTGPGERTVGTPGCARRVITVGAIDDMDQMARFSSRGPTADGRVKPDIVLPGVSIVAAQAAGTELGPVVTEGYIAISGTSMATPHASGVAALMLEANAQLTAGQVKTRMMAAAVDFGFQPNEQGAGGVDALQAYENALNFEEPAPSPEPEPEPQPLPQPEPRPQQPSGCLGGLTQLLRRK